MAPHSPSQPASRSDYSRSELDESTAGVDPFTLMARWLADAREQSGLSEPWAMALATADAEGHPSCRIVLLRRFDHEGLGFFTNYDSPKAAELEARPTAAATFYWPSLERQVRVRGEVARLPPEESDAYFAGRPRGSQVGAWASPQSRAIEGRRQLEEAVAAVEHRFADFESLPRPPFWGGYRLVPTRFEFWQGRASRLHDRIAFSPDGSGWRRVRLAP